MKKERQKKGNVVLSTRQTVPQDPTEQPRKLVRPVAHRKTGEGARRRTHTHTVKRVHKRVNFIIGGCSGSGSNNP